ncbi:hypothetical protein BJX64DRAFT_252476 [Aspergillus heterothallicus]
MQLRFCMGPRSQVSWLAHGHHYCQRGTAGCRSWTRQRKIRSIGGKNRCGKNKLLCCSARISPRLYAVNLVMPCAFLLGWLLVVRVCWLVGPFDFESWFLQPSSNACRTGCTVESRRTRYRRRLPFL